MVRVVRDTGCALCDKAEVIGGRKIEKASASAAAKALRKDSYHPSLSHLVSCYVWACREFQREVPHISSNYEAEQREGVSQASRFFEQRAVSEAPTFLEKRAVSEAPTSFEKRAVFEAPTFFEQRKPPQTPTFEQRAVFEAPTFFEQREVSQASSLLHALSRASCGVEQREEMSHA